MLRKQGGGNAPLRMQSEKEKFVWCGSRRYKGGRRKFSLVKQNSRMTMLALKEAKRKSGMDLPQGKSRPEGAAHRSDFSDLPRQSLERSMSVGNIIVGYLATECEKDMVDLDMDDESDSETDGGDGDTPKIDPRITSKSSSMKARRKKSRTTRISSSSPTRTRSRTN